MEPPEVSDLKWDIPLSVGTGVSSGYFYKFATRILFILLLRLKFLNSTKNPNNMYSLYHLGCVLENKCPWKYDQLFMTSKALEVTHERFPKCHRNFVTLSPLH